MGEIQEALRQANRTPSAGPSPDPLRERKPDPEILETFRALAPPATQVEREPVAPVPVSTEKQCRWQSREVIVDAHAAASESLRHLALRLRRELESRGEHSVAVLSALRREGKTTLACNLALALASLGAGRSVALVDLDLRLPRVAASMEIRGAVGIEDVLLGRATLRDACVSIGNPPLDVYPALRAQDDAHRTLGLPALRSAIRELEHEYEIVVVDTPPVLLVPDAPLLLESVKSAIAVVRARVTTQGSVQAMCKLLPQQRLIGMVLNDGALPVGSRHYGYYGPDEGRES